MSGNRENRGNISTEPIMGFFEVNVSAPAGIAASDDTRDQAEADLFADAIQVALRYIRTSTTVVAQSRTTCFFYHLGGRTIARRCRVGWFRPYICRLSFGPGQCRDNAHDIDAERLRAHLETLV